LAASAVSLLPPIQPAFTPDDILVVPLNVSSFCQPAFEMLQVDLIGRRVPGFGGFEAAFLLQPVFLKRLTAPKEKSDAWLQLAVPDHWVAIQKPHRMGMPDLVFRLWQSLVDRPSQKITDLSVLRTEGPIVFRSVGVHSRRIMRAEVAVRSSGEGPEAMNLDKPTCGRSQVQRLDGVPFVLNVQHPQLLGFLPAYWLSVACKHSEAWKTNFSR
jgi:hypothetical protein